MAVTEAVRASILESLSPDSLHILWSHNGEKLVIGAPVIGVLLVSEQVFNPLEGDFLPLPPLCLQLGSLPACEDRTAFLF